MGKRGRVWRLSRLVQAAPIADSGAPVVARPSCLPACAIGRPSTLSSNHWCRLFVAILPRLVRRSLPCVRPRLLGEKELASLALVEEEGVLCHGAPSVSVVSTRASYAGCVVGGLPGLCAWPVVPCRVPHATSITATSIRRRPEWLFLDHRLRTGGCAPTDLNRAARMSLDTETGGVSLCGSDSATEYQCCSPASFCCCWLSWQGAHAHPC